MISRMHLWIEGRVQGVWYRGSAAKQAQFLGLTGWVRNLPDGRVELVAEGESGAVESLRDWCAKGPPLARVTGIERRDEVPNGEFVSFEVLRGG